MKRLQYHDWGFVGLITLFGFMLIGVPILGGWGIYTLLHPTDYWQGVVAFIVGLFVAVLLFLLNLAIVLVLAN